MTTLAGYIHWYLTDEKVLGIGDASGMFQLIVKHRTIVTILFNALIKFSEKGYTQMLAISYLK